jgi:hypothetical protein
VFQADRCQANPVAESPRTPFQAMSTRSARVIDDKFVGLVKMWVRKSCVFLLNLRNWLISRSRRAFCHIVGYCWRRTRALFGVQATGLGGTIGRRAVPYRPGTRSMAAPCTPPSSALNDASPEAF